MNKLKNFDLLPNSTHYKNVRSNVSRSEWDIIRKEVYKESDHVCKWCGDTGFNQGKRHAVEAHEIFEFNEATQTQKLVDIVALCPRCHTTQHIGLAQIRNQTGPMLIHFAKVTLLGSDTVAMLYAQAIERYQRLSRISSWKLDLSYLQRFKKVNLQ